ncbi:MAG: RNA-binding protein [candidate division Zixibacteria bacterium]|nr:RNA-binding protein [candidate division Zixibacteria bacterium]
MQASKLFVGNLSFMIGEDELKAAFAPFGKVVTVNIIHGKGFGFVEMESPEAAQAAKDGMNGKELDGRPLTVDEARPPREGGGGGGGRGGFGGGGGRGPGGGGRGGFQKKRPRW